MQTSSKKFEDSHMNGSGSRLPRVRHSKPSHSYDDFLKSMGNGWGQLGSGLFHLHL